MTKLLYQSIGIDRANLLKKHQARLTVDRGGDTERSRTAATGKRGDQYHTQVIIDFRRRDNDAWPGFLYFAADGWIERNQPNIAAYKLGGCWLCHRLRDLRH